MRIGEFINNFGGKNNAYRLYVSQENNKDGYLKSFNLYRGTLNDINLDIFDSLEGSRDKAMRLAEFKHLLFHGTLKPVNSSLDIEAKAYPSMKVFFNDDELRDVEINEEYKTINLKFW